MHPWIKSALLPACSAYLINTPLQTLRRQARGAWPSRKSLANTSTSDLHHLLQRPRRRAQTDLVGRQQLHVAQRLPARQIDRAQSLLDQFSAGRPPLPCNRQSASEAGKTSNSQRLNLFYCSITEGANISSIFTRRGVSPCSNEYCAVVSSTLRLAAIPWRMSGVASALRASGGSKPVSR